MGVHGKVLENTLTKKTKHFGSLPNIGTNLFAGKSPIKKIYTMSFRPVLEEFFCCSSGLSWPSYIYGEIKDIFKASALWADAFYKSKCPYVCLFVCVCVHF